MIRETRSVTGGLIGKRIAALDIGSHTTRMLAAELTDSAQQFRPLIRRRVYTHLAEGFTGTNSGDLSQDAIERTACAVKNFAAVAGRLGVDEIRAVSTGVARRAANKTAFLDAVKDNAGIEVEIISGEQEALLTRRGVTYGSGAITNGSHVVFDLGGATTEFIWGKEDDLKIKSLPIGALILTQGFILSDPPQDEMLQRLSVEIDEILAKGLSAATANLSGIQVTGSGGTATTLAAIINRIGVRDILPENINGLTINHDRIKSLIEQLGKMPVIKRQKIRGMEQGRAEVILAGALAISRIMHFFGSTEISVSYSDILEGIIISYILGEDND
jgi:exopolyphosphatase / guanosine-5'-triphosphate,3'-diphosphate pyrophosphatase